MTHGVVKVAVDVDLASVEPRTALLVISSLAEYIGVCSDIIALRDNDALWNLGARYYAVSNDECFKRLARVLHYRVTENLKITYAI